ncbi:MAG: hypothetical protein JXB88_11080 [Spirochaetales bacterium]|nr:hypothetical protein [Spirochaetales bacterium]
MKVRLVVFICLITCFAAYGNVGFYEPGKAGVIYPASSSHLVMKEENIDIDIYFRHRTENFSEYDPKGFFYIEYRCSYRFKNEGKAGTYLLGYPVTYGDFGLGGQVQASVCNFQCIAVLRFLLFWGYN